MNKNKPSEPVRTSPTFRVLQATLILLAIEGKELADENKDKLWRCLCNAILWALDGVISKKFVFDVAPKKALAANIAKKADYPARIRWIEKVETALDKAQEGIADSTSPSAYAEQLCFSLLESVLLVFKQGKYSAKVSILFQSAQSQLENAPIPKEVTHEALEKIPLHHPLVEALN